MKIKIFSVNDVYKLEHLSRLHQYIKDTAENDVTYSTMNGDFLSPSLLFSLDFGKSMIDVLNSINISFLCFGNHEFDYPLDQVIERINEVENAIWLNSNICGLEKYGVELPRYYITDNCGFKIAWLGFCVENTPKMTRLKDELVFQNVVKQAKELVSEIRSNVGVNKVDMIIALTHQTIKEDEDLLKLVPEIDIVLGGHEHIPYYSYNDINNNILIKSGIDSEYVSVIEIEKTDRITKSVKLVDLRDYPSDPLIDNKIRSHEAILGVINNFVLHKFPEGVVLSSKEPRGNQTTFGKFIGDILKDELNADIIMLNSGGFRQRIDYSGDLTFGDILKEFVYDNNMVTIQLKGIDIANIFDYTYKRSKLDSEWGGYIQFDGGIKNIENTLTHINNMELNGDKYYKVGVIGNMLEGLDDNEPLIECGRRIENLRDLIEDGIKTNQLILRGFAKKNLRVIEDFQNIDYDGDNFITKEELKMGLYRLTNKEYNDYEVETFIKAIDSNNDGMIDRDEFALILKDI